MSITPAKLFNYIMIKGIRKEEPCGPSGSLRDSSAFVYLFEECKLRFDYLLVFLHRNHNEIIIFNANGRARKEFKLLIDPVVKVIDFTIQE